MSGLFSLPFPSHDSAVMKPLFLTATVLLLGTGSALGGTVSIRANGVVAANSLSVSSLAGHPFGAPLVMTFDVVTPGSPWPSAPADGFEYAIDPSSFSIEVNGAVLGMVSAAEKLLLIDGLPVADRLHINVGGLDSGLGMGYEVGFTGATFDSLDIEEQVGLYDFSTLTSYSWILSGQGVGAMFIDFTDVEIIGGPVGTPFCLGDGGGTPCPCGNTGAAGAGCANATGSGGTLVAGGSTSVGADDIEFSVSGLPANKPSLLFVGDASLGLGGPFGDGLLCVGGQIQRLDVLFTDGAGAATWPTGQSVQGGWAAGDQRWFQVWYRDTTGPCNGLFNTSSGLDVSFDL